MSTFFALATIILSLAFSPSYGCNNLDNKAFLAFKNSFPTHSLPWTPSTDCCFWESVRCDSTTGCVDTSLSFYETVEGPTIYLNGSIPPSIGDFSALQTLSFSSFPTLVGPIPPQITKLKNLKSLTLYNTGISGPIPSFLSTLPVLEQLNLARNLFSGPSLLP